MIDLIHKKVRYYYEHNNQTGKWNKEIHFLKPVQQTVIAEKLKEVLENTDEILFQKGTEARKFVLEQKNNVIQAQKILEMLQ